MRKNQQGLTLIEVLIASMILFISIGLTSSIFQHGFLLQNRVFEQINIESKKNEIINNIRFSLEQGDLLGTIHFSDLDVEWEVISIEQQRPFRFYNIELEQAEFALGEMKLMTINYSILNSDDVIKSHEYRELIWHP